MRNTIGHELVSAGRVRTGNDDTFPHGRVLAEHRLDFTQFDAEAGIFNWRSMRPRYSRSRWGETVRGRPCGRVARPARCKRIGMNRSADKSGRFK